MIAQIARKLRRRWRDQVKLLPFSDGFWCYSRRGRRDDPAQGWKIHISATPLSASAVLSRVRPILIEHDALFKVPRNLEVLAGLNSGLAQFSQVGKFLTIYPRSENESVALARKLHLATHGLRGPRIPFDACYRKNSVIHYRYGCFGQIARGSIKAGAIVDPAGRAHPDERAPDRAIPRWLSDPFRPPAKPNAGHIGGPLAPDYLPFKVIAQRGKGGVYEAIDLSAARPRVVIIKEGRVHGEVAWDGEDGRARVQQEGRVLRQLRAAGVPVPEILREFNRDGHHYLVLEKIEGRPLLPRNNTQPARISWRRAAKILEQLGLLLSMVHAAGWVWRDCKPSHVFVQRGQLRLIDFEGACRIGEQEVLPWGSENYFPPIYRKSFRRSPGMLEDDHALGVIAFQFGTGEIPPREARARGALYERSNCPDLLRNKIEGLLRFTNSRRKISGSIAAVVRE